MILLFCLLSHAQVREVAATDSGVVSGRVDSRHPERVGEEISGLGIVEVRVALCDQTLERRGQSDRVRPLLRRRDIWRSPVSSGGCALGQHDGRRCVPVRAEVLDQRDCVLGDQRVVHVPCTDTRVNNKTKPETC